jgi:hypothetical protein
MATLKLNSIDLPMNKYKNDISSIRKKMFTKIEIKQNSKLRLEAYCRKYGITKGDFLDEIFLFFHRTQTSMLNMEIMLSVLAEDCFYLEAIEKSPITKIDIRKTTKQRMENYLKKQRIHFADYFLDTVILLLYASQLPISKMTQLPYYLEIFPIEPTNVIDDIFFEAALENAPDLIDLSYFLPEM